MEFIAKIILIATTYIVLIEKESFLNTKSTNHKETNSKTYTITFILYHDALVISNWLESLNRY